MNMNKPFNIYWIDLFAGAGGTSTGIHMAEVKAKVIACVNHDAMAIASHRENHPDCHHFTEDIRDFNVVLKLKKITDALRAREPDCYINIWASLECTNYSKAKGGLPRDADSRTLANDLLMYVDELKPDYLFIENVREFMAWGPLDKHGKPVSREQGVDYIKWYQNVSRRGYTYSYRLLNSADYGAYTSRERYFAQFAKNDLPVAWPEATHAKNPVNDPSFFDRPAKKWKAVREVLDLQDEGASIFERKKPLSENTLKRIYAGLIKFVANGETEFIKKYYSGRPSGKVISVNGPAGTITTIDGQAIVKVKTFLCPYYGNSKSMKSIDEPCDTLTTKDRFSKVDTHFFSNYYSNNGNHASIDVPAPTIMSVPKSSLITAKPWLMDTNFRNVGTSLDDPARTIVAARKHHYLLNPQFMSKGSSLNDPCFTLIARMDKKPPYLVEVESGNFCIVIFQDDSEMTIKIKEFMAAYGIIDIRMRMLKIIELLRIQGFPAGYKLKGTKTEQKKFIGNSVVPKMAKCIVEANYQSIVYHLVAA